MTIRTLMAMSILLVASTANAEPMCPYRQQGTQALVVEVPCSRLQLGEQNTQVEIQSTTPVEEPKTKFIEVRHVEVDSI